MLLKLIFVCLMLQQGEIYYENCLLYVMSEVDCCCLLCIEWGVVYQYLLDGLCCQVLVGGNIGEWLMVIGARYYGDICVIVQKWLEEVEIFVNWIDDLLITFFGGMQQCLQIVCNLVMYLKLVFMDELIGGLDVLVQVCLFDLLCGLVVELNLVVVIVIYDLGVVCLLVDCLLVMKQG